MSKTDQVHFIHSLYAISAASVHHHEFNPYPVWNELDSDSMAHCKQLYKDLLDKSCELRIISQLNSEYVMKLYDYWTRIDHG